LVHFRSTWNAIAYDRNRSNISGVRIRANVGSSTRRRNSSKPSTRSRARAPATVRAGMIRLKINMMTAVNTAATPNGAGVRFTRGAMVTPTAITPIPSTTALTIHRVCTSSGRAR